MKRELTDMVKRALAGDESGEGFEEAILVSAKKGSTRPILTRKLVNRKTGEVVRTARDLTK